MKKIIVLSSILVLSACSNGEQNVFLTKTCAIDAPINNSRQSVAKELNVVGWAFDSTNSDSITKVRLQFKSMEKAETKVFDAPFNIKRPDIATAFHNPKLETSGFSKFIPANSLVPGKYEITILQDRSKCSTSYVVVME